jgi:hypothetical protein
MKKRTKKSSFSRKEKALTAAELKKIAAGLLRARDDIRAAEVVILGKIAQYDPKGFYGKYPA